MPAGVTPGRISWFGGPHDPTAGSNTASGAPITEPGIAVYNQSTLGGWWLVKLPNGVIALLKQTDIGPSPSTGRTFDFTSSALGSLGYSEKTFPTDSTAQGVFLGKAPSITGLLTGATVSHFWAAMKALGATNAQGVAFTRQSDVGAGKTPGALIAVDPSGKAASNVSTAPSGDAIAGGINIPNPLNGIASIAALLTSSQFWLRLGEALAGIILMAMGLRSLTGTTTSPATVARAAAKRIK